MHVMCRGQGQKGIAAVVGLCRYRRQGGQITRKVVSSSNAPLVVAASINIREASVQCCSCVGNARQKVVGQAQAQT